MFGIGAIAIGGMGRTRTLFSEEGDKQPHGQHGRHAHGWEFHDTKCPEAKMSAIYSQFFGRMLSDAGLGNHATEQSGSVSKAFGHLEMGFSPVSRF